MRRGTIGRSFLVSTKACYRDAPRWVTSIPHATGGDKRPSYCKAHKLNAVGGALGDGKCRFALLESPSSLTPPRVGSKFEREWPAHFPGRVVPLPLSMATLS